MKPIKIHSFKDAIFFPFRLVYNLDIWWKAVLGLGIVLILAGIQLSIFGKDDKPSAETVAAVNDGWLRTGMVDDNLDSVRVHRGDSLRLLARQGHLLWAETLDRKHRGFVRDSLMENSADGLGIPVRRKLSGYFISQMKFESLMSDSATTFDRLEQEYIHAEYLKSLGKKFVGEYGLMVEDSLGNIMRPVITFNADSTIDGYVLHKFRSHSVALGQPLMDIVSPVISTREFQKTSPFDNNILQWLWVIFPGFLMVYIIILLLWARLPLYFMTNVVVNLLLAALVVLGPLAWGVMMVKMGFSSVGVSLITGGAVLIGAFLLWLDYSGLRCPRCKHLRHHELKRITSGKPFVRHGFTEKVKCREVLEHTVETTSYNPTERDPRSHKYERHFGKKRVYYDVYEYWDTVLLNTRHFECPRCGHGRQEGSEEVLNHKQEYVRSYSKEEKFDYTEKKY